MKWEYYHAGSDVPITLEWLNIMGMDEWELVCLEPKVIFKRPLPAKGISGSDVKIIFTRTKPSPK